MFKRNGQPINIGADLVVGEGDAAITIPAASLLCAETREQYGIIEEPDPVRGDDRYYWNTSDGSVPKALEDLQAVKLDELASARYSIEVGGINISGVRIKTDRESQAQLSSVFASLSGGLIPDTPWKSVDGWVQVTLEGITPIAQAVAAHVRACFAWERSQQEALQALVDAQDVDGVIAFAPQMSLST